MGGLLPPAEVTPRPGSSSTGAGSGVVAVRHPGSGPTESGSNPGRAPDVLCELDFGLLGRRNRTATRANASLSAPHDGIGAPAHRTSTEVRGWTGPPGTNVS